MLRLLSAKPVLYVCNVAEGDASTGNSYCKLVADKAKAEGAAFVVVAAYVLCHSTTYFIHVATLTVAINSNEQALITVLILNNFAEIKGFVFKKFDKTTATNPCRGQGMRDGRRAGQPGPGLLRPVPRPHRDAPLRCEPMNPSLLKGRDECRHQD